MKTDQAKAAAEIKKHLKSKGLKCSVTSSSGSMTSSVRVKLFDQDPKTVKEITKFANQYQYGHFDGMTDMYENSNTNATIPQAKFVFTENRISSEMYQKAWDYMRPIYAGADDLPVNYKDIGSSDMFMDEWAHSVIHRFINGYFDEKTSQKFWDSLKPETPAKKEINGITIEEHTHTKKGFQMFICILPGRVEREEYLELLDTARSLGGWYSRKWGKTPAGFAFKDKNKALEFSGNTPTMTPTEKQKTVKPIKKIDHSEKLVTLADKMQNQIDDKFADRQTNTPKRLAQASQARLEGERLQRTQTVLYALADMHKQGTLPDLLTKFTSKKSVYDAMASKKNLVPNGYHQYYICTGEPYEETPEIKLLWSLLTGKTEEEKQAEELQRTIDGLQFSKIPGYFPTPNNVIDKMIEYADIQTTDRVLEPEIGSCVIADKVAPLCKEVKGFEVNHTLGEIAEKKDYLIELKDFLSVKWEDITQYEKILMNPPFENKQDIKHIKHAVQFLKAGGKLVAICANGSNQQKELMPIADHWEELPQGSFKSSGTMVNTALLVINN